MNTLIKELQRTVAACQRYNPPLIFSPMGWFLRMWQTAVTKREVLIGTQGPAVLKSSVLDSISVPTCTNELFVTNLHQTFTNRAV